MAGADAGPRRRAWPIIYGPRPGVAPTRSPRLAWALFLLIGLPFVLMTVLTLLAQAGIYVDVFRPFWRPWPPELWKPFLGLFVFAVTLAYLAYRLGHRAGYHTGAGAGLAAARTVAEASAPAIPPPPAEAVPDQAPVPPPPPPLEAAEVEAGPDRDEF